MRKTMLICHVAAAALLTVILGVATPLAASGAPDHLLIAADSSTLGGFGPNVRVSDPSVNARKMLPNVAVDGKGGVFAAYIEDAGTGKDIYLTVSKDWGKTWSRLGRANDVQGKVWSAQQAQPAVAVDPANGNVYVAWTDNRASSSAFDIYASASTNGGISFAAGVKVDKTTSGAQLVIRLGVDSMGMIHVVWANEEVLPARLGYASSMNSGATFSTPKWIDQAGTESCECCSFSMLFGPGNEVRVFYRSGTAQKLRNTYTIKSTDMGSTWGAPVKVSDWDWTASACPATGPAVARDSNGNLHVLAADVRSGDRDVYHYKSTDGGSTWSMGMKMNTPTAGSQDQTSLMAAGDDLVAMWEDRGTDASGDAMYRVSTDQGANWGAEAKLSDVTTNAQEMPLGAAMGDAGFAIWGDSRSGGNEVFGCAYFGADVQPPTVSITAPTNGSVVGGQVDITADASDNIVVMKVEFQVDGVKKGEAVVAPYKWAWDTLAETEGAHAVKAIATDGAGNTAQSTVNVEVKNQGTDIDPPTVAFTAPANGATVQGTLTLGASATDNKGVRDVEFFVDAASVGKASALPYQIQWDSTTVATGAHILLARATDTSGNQANTTINVTVDQGGQDVTPPTVMVDAPLDSATVGGIVKVKATITDNTGVTSATLKVDGISKGDDTVAPWEWDLDSTKLNDGSHTLVVEGKDAAGNIGDATIPFKSKNAVIDRPPTITIDSPKANEHVKGKVTVRADATDDRGVESVTFLLGTTTQFKDTSSPYSWEWDTTVLADGEQRITAKATDSAGNSTSALVTVVVSNGLGSAPISKGILGFGQYADYAVAGLVVLVIAAAVLALTRGKKDRQQQYDAHLRQQGWR